MMAEWLVPGKLFIQSRVMGASIAGILLACVSVYAANAAAPAEVMQAAIQKVLVILKDPKLKSADKRQARLEQLRSAIYPKFDFAEMAKRSLGSHWQKRSADEQRQFVKLFTDLIENAYMENLEAYDGENVMITNEKQDKEYAEVNSKIAAKNGQDHTVDYKLHQVGGDWKVYDVVIENISLVNNYRSQFNRVISQASFEELVRRMQNKQFGGDGKKAKTKT